VAGAIKAVPRQVMAALAVGLNEVEPHILDDQTSAVTSFSIPSKALP
jgi:hypothetical protein